MRDGGDVAAAMEVSSHALSLHRADAIHWDVAAFTNLTQDHLDFHADMEDYFLAKRRLFEVAAEQGATLIVNVDDPYGARLARRLPAGGDGRDRRARTRRVRATDLRRRPGVDRLHRRRHRVARAAARALQRPQRARRDGRRARAGRRRRDDRRARCPRAGGVPGRFEPVDEGQEFAVIVDYAHKPDALDNVLRTARELATRAR